MVAGVLRAVPWPAVGGITAVAAVTGAGGLAWPGGARFLLPIAFALLAGAAAFVLIVPGFLPVARWIHLFPVTAPPQGGLSATTFWWLAGGTCLAAIAASVAELGRPGSPGPGWRAGGCEAGAHRRSF